LINLQYEYAKLIQQELDKNTQGLRFEVSLNNLKTDSELQRFLQIPNTYAQEIKRYIPVVIETFDGDFAELENMSAAEIFANMTMLIPTDDFDVNNQVIEETFVLVSQALNEMSKRTRAKVFQLGEKCFLLPRNNESTIDLSDVFGVNLELNIEFTNKEENDILETLDGVKIIKNQNGFEIDGFPVVTNYEIDKKYKIELKPRELDTDYVFEVQTAECFDLEEAEQRINSNAPLTSAIYDIPGTIGRIDSVKVQNGVTTFCARYWFEVQTNEDGDNEWVFVGLQDETGTADNKFYSFYLDGKMLFTFKVTENNLGDEIKLFSQYEKLYSIIVKNHQNEIVFEEDDFTILSNEGGIPWGSEGTITLNFSLPRRVTNQMTLGEYNYQEFEINASGAYNDRAFVGQHIEYYLNGVRIFPVSRDEGYIGEPDNARFLGSNKGNRSVIEQTSIGKEYAVYYIPEPKVVELIEQITSQEPDANKIYDLKIVYPLFVREHKTVISQGGLSIVNSTPIGVAFSLEIADDEILT